MKKPIILLIFLLTGLFCLGQKKDTIIENRLHNNNVYFEALGNAQLYSLNYEKLIYSKQKFYTFGRIGIGYLYIPIGDVWGYNDNVYGVVVMINESYQLKKNFFIRVGVGPTLILEHEVLNGPPYSKYVPRIVDSRTLYYSAFVGFLLKDKKGFFYQLGYTPLLWIQPNVNFLWIPGGIAFGYTFGK